MVPLLVDLGRGRALFAPTQAQAAHVALRERGAGAAAGGEREQLAGQVGEGALEVGGEAVGDEAVGDVAGPAAELEQAPPRARRRHAGSPP